MVPLALALGWQATPALAQNDQQAEDESIEEVVITGSRIRRAGIDVSRPNIGVGQDTLDKLAFTNIADALNEVPAFGNGLTSSGIQGNAFTIGQNYVDLFDLGSQRTLTLVNGKRFVSSNPPIGGQALNGPRVDLGSQVNINSVPVALLDRIEVVPLAGGAVYGSDAVAGVVNVFLRDDYEGFEISAQKQQTAESDGEAYQMQLVFGTNFDDGRGNLAVSFERNKQVGLGTFARDWLVNGEYADESVGVLDLDGQGGPCNPRNREEQSGCDDLNGDGSPENFRAIFRDGIVQVIGGGGGGITLDELNFPGVGSGILFAPNSGLGAMPDGKFYQFQDGDLVECMPADPGGTIVRVYSASPDACGVHNFFERSQQLRSPLDRTVSTVNLTYRIADNLKYTQSVIISQSDAAETATQGGFQTGFFTGETGPLLVQADHPLLSQQARDLLANMQTAPTEATDNMPAMPAMAAPVTEFRLHRYNNDLVNHGRNVVKNFLVRNDFGLDGHFDWGGRTFFWDFSAVFGISDVENRSTGIIDARFFNAFDAVRLDSTALADIIAAQQAHWNVIQNSSHAKHRDDFNGDGRGNTAAAVRANIAAEMEPALRAATTGENARPAETAAERAAANLAADIKARRDITDLNADGMLDINDAVQQVINAGGSGVADIANGSIICRVNLLVARGEQLDVDGDQLDGADGFNFPAQGGGLVDQNRPFSDGCAPVNLFGEGASSPESLSFITGSPLITSSELRQTVFSANLSGPIVDLPGGPLEFAVGWESRTDEGDFNAGLAVAVPVTRSSPADSTTGKLETEEFYGELRIPVISEDMGIPWMQAVELDLAVRQVENSISGVGSQTDDTFEGRILVRPVPWLTLRGTVASAIRAPGLVELFTPRSQSFISGADPCDARSVNLGGAQETRRANCIAHMRELGVLGYDPTSFESQIQNGTIAGGIVQGNRDLRAEQSESWSVGFVFEPIDSLTVSMDWLNIEIEDRIENFEWAVLGSACYDDPIFPNEFCGRFERDPATGQIISVEETFLNSASSRWFGANMQAQYSMQVEELMGRDLGSLDWRLSFLYVRTDESRATPTSVNRDTTGGFNISSSDGVDDQVPDFEGVLDTTWEHGPWRVFHRINFQDQPKLSITGDTYFLDISAANLENANRGHLIEKTRYRFIHNTSVSYRITENATVQLTVDNLFDRRPNAIEHAAGYFAVDEILGRRYSLRMRSSF